MKIKLKPILLLVGALAIVYAGIFLLPNHIEALALIPEKFFSGEIWRLVTFQFTHLSELHLFENIAGVLLVGFLATELKIATSDFSFVYFLSGSLAPLPIFTVVSFAALGASAAIYGALGLILLEATKFSIKISYVAVALIAAIFLQSGLMLFSYGVSCEGLLFNLKQAATHFSGLIFGLGIFFLITKTRWNLTKKKRQILRSEIEVG